MSSINRLIEKRVTDMNRNTLSENATPKCTHNYEIVYKDIYKRKTRCPGSDTIMDSSVEGTIMYYCTKCLDEVIKKI